MSVQDRIEREMTFPASEFELEEIEGGTRLLLVESGFASLPAESRDENEAGWDEELGHLRNYLLGLAVTGAPSGNAPIASGGR